MSIRDDQHFCMECGTKLQSRFIKKFDPMSGRQLKEKYCPNLKCEDGCGDAGHVYKFPYWSCSRCGHTDPDY